MWCKGTLVVSIFSVGLINSSQVAVAQRHSVIKPITGIIVDEQGNPVAAAKVSNIFSNCPIRETQSDSAGKFTIESSFGGNSDLLVAIAPNEETQGVLALPDNVAKWDGKEVRIVLKPASPLRIKVINGEDKPVADAKAGAVVRYGSFNSHKIWGSTNADGIATFKIPSGATSASFLAIKSGVGLDYLNYGDERQSAQVPEETSLMLDGAKPFEFFAKDEDGLYVAEASVYFLSVSRPAPPIIELDNDNAANRRRPLHDDINLSYFADELQLKSDAEGKVRVDWWPAWSDYLTAFGKLDGYTHARLDAKLKEESPFNILRFHKLIKISGMVISQTGEPVPGAEVVLGGRGSDNDGTNISMLTDATGKFEFGVPPHQLCMVGARSGKLVSPPIHGLISKPGEAIQGLELKLQPGIRVYGTVATAILPAEGAQIMLKEIGKTLAEFPGVSFPEVENPSLPPGFKPKLECHLVFHCETDKRGKYEFYVPPGDYTIMLPLNPLGHETFKLTTEKEYEVTFRGYIPVEGIIEKLAK